MSRRGALVVRLWSIHPRYLDSRGLVALWREALLAKHVLEGKTKGYRHHPQLIRFSQHENGIVAINAYLWHVFWEAKSRGYNFDFRKLHDFEPVSPIYVSEGQILYEWHHLMKKLEKRAPAVFDRWRSVTTPEAFPIMEVVPGGIEPWEIAVDYRPDDKGGLP
jgi:hypothetical protein